MFFLSFTYLFHYYEGYYFRFVVFDMAGLTSDNSPAKKCVKDGAMHTLTSVFLGECKLSVSLLVWLFFLLLF